MKPHLSKIRRILPYSLPVSIALLAVGWMVIPGPGNGSNATHSPSEGASRGGEVAHKSLTMAAERAKVRELVSAQEKVDEEPLNPQVAELFDQFRASDRLIPQTSAWELTKTEKGKSAVISFAGMELKGIVDSKSDTNGVILLGMKLDNDLGRFQMSLRPDDRILAHVFFNGESHALAIKGFPQDGSWKVEKSSVSEAMCAPAGSTYPLVRDLTALRRANPSSKAPQKAGGPIAALPELSSDPDSTFVLYIDFDGETVTHPLWNDGNTIVAEPSEFVDDEDFVTAVWRRTTEDYIGFDINVTTSRAVFDAAAVERRVHCIVTATNDAAPGAGGVAYLNSFGQDVPCWCFNPTEFSIADTISHEVGHTVGLLHDGLEGGYEYYGGHGTGETSWSPIMGAAWADFEAPFLEEEVTQWSKGEYPDASNQEDDLKIITTENGFGYRKDDKGDSRATAANLIVKSGVVSDSGVIGQNTDQDWFSFGTSGGQVSLNVKALDVDSSNDPQRGANLAVNLELLDSTGTLVTSVTPTDTLDASLTMNLKEGSYFLKVTGGARGSLDTGFPIYGCIGQYSISGSVPQTNPPTVTPDTSSFVDVGGIGRFKVASKGSWSWKSSATWVTSSEPTRQTGNQDFEFTVAPSPSRATRTATITIIANSGLTAVHTVTQEGTDDHGDVISTATLVDQNSTTPGVFEEAGDYDVFRIDVKGFGTLTVQSTGSTNTFGELLDYFGTRLASNDNTVGPNFRIVRSVGSGTYFVRLRHTRATGVGPYQMVSSFVSGPTLFISSDSKVISSAGGPSGFQVTCNTSWSWSTNASWIRSSEAVRQKDGQTFNYVVLPNQTNKVRVGRIILRSAGGAAIHTVTQNPMDSDDHGNTPVRATEFPTNSIVSGRLEADRDVDVFSMEFATSGELELRSVGFTDTMCDLVDAEGNLVAFNDDADGENFSIKTSIPAGVYYVKVKAFANKELGSYRLLNRFTPSSLIDLRYRVSEGGGIRGPVRQTVKLGDNGSEVIAVATRGYSFVRWSDGKKAARRVDLDLRTPLDVTAEFKRTLEVNFISGRALEENQIPPVDFGTIRDGGKKVKFFEIRNNSKKRLTGLKAVASGPDASSWTSNSLPAVLNPGASARLAITLRGRTEGSKLALFTVSARESAAARFRIQVMGVVDNAATVARAALAKSSASATPSGSGSVARKATGRQAAASLSEVWLAVSPDGLLRYRFYRAKRANAEPVLWISANGESWAEAKVLSIDKVSSGAKTDEYEALVEPLRSKGLVWVITENPPKRK